MFASTSFRRVASLTAVTAAAGGLYRTQAVDGECSEQTLPIPPNINAGLPISNEDVPSRNTQVHSLKDGRKFDVLVVGGGASGAGIALDAQSRGLRTALIEREDFACGTSSRSTKLIHGGVRYLEKAFTQMDYKQLQLVIDALEERKHLLNITPNLSNYVPILVPMYDSFPKILFFFPYYWIGMKLYDFFAGHQGSLITSYVLSYQRCLEQFPMLNEKGLQGGIVYFDGQHNDARMNSGIALTAAAWGATVCNHVELVSLHKSEEGKVSGARVRDTLSGEEWDVQADVVVNATGPFSDGLRHMDDPSAPQLIAPSSGVHVVLPDRFSPKEMGLLIPKTEDGRMCFLLPWEGSTVGGTTDDACEVSTLPKATTKEVDFILKEVSKYLNTKVDRGDVDSAWSGIRPLAYDLTKKGEHTQELSRDHVIEVTPSGLVTIAGGKWTTYRLMAEDAVDRILEEFDLTAQYRCATKDIKLIGAAGWSLSVPTALMRKGFPENVAEHLSHNYGDKAYEVAEIALLGYNKLLTTGHPQIEAEIVYCARHEMAETAIDVLSRRTRLAFLNSNAAMSALPRVIALMADEKGWNDERRLKEFHETQRFLRTMNVFQGNTNKYYWHMARPLYFNHLRMKQLYGFAPLTLSQMKDMWHAFKKFTTPDSFRHRNTATISLECARELVELFVEKNPSRKDRTQAMASWLESMDEQEVEWEDLAFSIALYFGDDRQSVLLRDSPSHSSSLEGIDTEESEAESVPYQVSAPADEPESLASTSPDAVQLQPPSN